jgi:hypothetical protein
MSQSVVSEEGNVSNALLNVISQLSVYTNKYFLGFVIIIGISGNILSIIVFRRCKRRDLVTVTYLTPLAYADLITLLYGAYTWIVTGILEKSGGYFFTESCFSLHAQIWCKCIGYVYRTSSSISSYILVLFSCERCIGVWLPLKVHSIITKHRRVVLITVMYLVQFIVYSPILVYYSLYYVSSSDMCNCFFQFPYRSAVIQYSIIELLDNFLPHALPCLLILTLSILIVIKLQKAERKAAAIRGKVRTDRSNLVSLLMICLLYIVCTAPHVAVWGYFDYFDQYIGDFLWHTQQEVTVLYMFGRFTLSVAMLNYSFNFLIYSFTLKIYKDELRLIARACCVCFRPKPASSISLQGRQKGGVDESNVLK